MTPLKPYYAPVYWSHGLLHVLGAKKSNAFFLGKGCGEVEDGTLLIPLPAK